MSRPASSSKTRVAAVSIVASASMAVIKFVVGVAIGSLALISEALHSSVDLAATVVTWIVVRISDRPADEEHHYGHGKIENLSAFGQAILLVVTGMFILKEGYSRLAHPEAGPHPLAAGDKGWYAAIAVVSISLVVDLSRSRALARASRACSS